MKFPVRCFRMVLAAGAAIVLAGCDSDKDAHGYFLVGGKRNRPLLTALKNPSGSDGTSWDPNKYQSSLNRIAEELCYVDPSKRPWIVPAGTDNDGASVPPLLHSFIPGGLNSQGRFAAIVHDYYCDIMSGDGKKPDGGYPEIHKMFYHGLLCCEVDKKTAALMYYAVVKFGPPHDRSLWARIVTEANPELAISASADKEQRFSEWLAGYEIREVDGKKSVVSSTTSSRIKEAQTALEKAEKEAEQARQTLEALKKDIRSVEEQINEVTVKELDDPDAAAASREEREQMHENLENLLKETESVSNRVATAEKTKESVQKVITASLSRMVRQTAADKQIVPEVEAAKTEILSIPEDEISPERIDRILQREAVAPKNEEE